jgi:hypothetical protein
MTIIPFPNRISAQNRQSTKTVARPPRFAPEAEEIMWSVALHYYEHSAMTLKDAYRIMRGEFRHWNAIIGPRLGQPAIVCPSVDTLRRRVLKLHQMQIDARKPSAVSMVGRIKPRTDLA